MRSVNKVILLGNLGSDPEIRTTSAGVKVAQFSLATSRQWKDRAGEKHEETQWHRIVCWDGLADIAEQYLRKGQQVHVEGEIKYRTYEASDGSGTRYVTEIRALEVVMTGKAENRGQGSGAATRRESRQLAGVGAGDGGEGSGYGYDGVPGLEDADDLPF